MKAFGLTMVIIVKWLQNHHTTTTTTSTEVNHSEVVTEPPHHHNHHKALMIVVWLLWRFCRHLTLIHIITIICSCLLWADMYNHHQIMCEHYWPLEVYISTHN